LGEGAHDARSADAGADIGRAGNHRLDGLARALGADVFQHQPVLLEDAGVLPQRRRLVFPVIDLPDRELERVLGRRGGGHQRERRDKAERGDKGFARFHLSPPCLFYRSDRREAHSTPDLPDGKAQFVTGASASPNALRLSARALLASTPGSRRPWPPASTSIPTSA